MAAAQIRDLPGVGWAGEEKLMKRIGVDSMTSLLAVPLARLVFVHLTVDPIGETP